MHFQTIRYVEANARCTLEVSVTSLSGNKQHARSIC